MPPTSANTFLVNLSALVPRLCRLLYLPMPCLSILRIARRGTQNPAGRPMMIATRPARSGPHPTWRLPVARRWLRLRLHTWRQLQLQVVAGRPVGGVNLGGDGGSASGLVRIW